MKNKMSGRRQEVTTLGRDGELTAARKGFKASNLINDWVETVGEDFDCGYCDRVFDTQEALNSHTGLCHRDEHREVFECDNCGDEISRPPCFVNDNNFCDMDCMGEFRAEKNEYWSGGDRSVECDWCGEDIKKKPSAMKEKNFCDYSCFGDWCSENRVGEDSPFYGETHSEEALEKLRNRDYNWQKGENNHNYGGLSEETKLKMSETMKEKAENGELYAQKNEDFKEMMSRRMSGSNSPRWNRVKRECGNCGADVKVPRHKLDVNDNHFCDRDCYWSWRRDVKPISGEKNYNWQGGYEYNYGDNWKEQRQKALDRDNGKCQICGAADNVNGWDLDIHHIVPFREFSDYREANKLKNLVALCRSCHLQVEHAEGSRGTVVGA